MFQTTDIEKYTPGKYYFKIFGTVGNISTPATFNMTLVNPCEAIPLKIKQPDPFTDRTYVLKDPQIDQVWDIDSLVTHQTQSDCGELSVQFYGADKELDSELFSDIRQSTTYEGLQNFATLYTEDYSKLGFYQIKYRAFHEKFQNNIAYGQTFTI